MRVLQIGHNNLDVKIRYFLTSVTMFTMTGMPDDLTIQTERLVLTLFSLKNTFGLALYVGSDLINRLSEYEENQSEIYHLFHNASGTNYKLFLFSFTLIQFIPGALKVFSEF